MLEAARARRMQNQSHAIVAATRIPSDQRARERERERPHLTGAEIDFEKSPSAGGGSGGRCGCKQTTIIASVRRRSAAPQLGAR